MDLKIQVSLLVSGYVVNFKSEWREKHIFSRNYVVFNFPTAQKSAKKIQQSQMISVHLYFEQNL